MRQLRTYITHICFYLLSIFTLNAFVFKCWVWDFLPSSGNNTYCKKGQGLCEQYSEGMCLGGLKTAILRASNSKAVMLRVSRVHRARSCDGWLKWPGKHALHLPGGGQSLVTWQRPSLIPHGNVKPAEAIGIGRSSPVRDFRQTASFLQHKHWHEEEGLFSTVWWVCAHRDVNTKSKLLKDTAISQRGDRDGFFFTNPWMTLKPTNTKIKLLEFEHYFFFFFLLDRLRKNCAQLPRSANSLLVCIF